MVTHGITTNSKKVNIKTVAEFIALAQAYGAGAIQQPDKERDIMAFAPIRVRTDKGEDYIVPIDGSISESQLAPRTPDVQFNRIKDLSPWVTNYCQKDSCLTLSPDGSLVIVKKDANTLIFGYPYWNNNTAEIPGQLARFSPSNDALLVWDTDHFAIYQIKVVGMSGYLRPVPVLLHIFEPILQYPVTNDLRASIVHWSQNGNFLNYVVYSALDNRLEPNRQLILYDILHSKIIWHVAQDSGLTPPFSYDPVWALDSSFFVYVRLPQNATTFAFELYSVDTQGIEKQLTNLGVGGTSSSLIFAPHISPNNKFIAFWKASPQIYMDPDANFKFTLLDLDSKQVKSFDLTHGNSGFFDMHWSPDSDAIALINGIEINEQVLSVLDIKTGGKEQITHHAAAILTWCKCNITVNN